MKKEDTKYCNCLFYTANAFSRVMSKLADEEFAVLGLSSSYAFLLMSISDKPGIQPKEISQQLQLTPSTITRLIEKMEYQGFLKRNINGRNTEVYPTLKTADLLADIKSAWANIYERYVAVLGKETSKQLTVDINEALSKLG